MSAFDLAVFVLIAVLIAAAAFAAGYFIGRFKALAERGITAPRDYHSPLPGPEDGHGEAHAAPAPSRGRTSRTPPRRSTAPPPAIAGLMNRGSAEKPGNNNQT